MFYSAQIFTLFARRKKLKTAFNTPAATSRIASFYDTGSIPYLKVFGQHLHDGYYVTGNESIVEAQENMIRHLALEAGIKPRSRILDVGCGMGGSSAYLARHFQADVTGITISPVQADIARKKCPEGRFFVMDAEKIDRAELDPAGGGFDVV